MSYTTKTIDPPSWLVVFTILLIGVWLLGNLLRLPLPFGGVVYPHDVLLTLLCLCNWSSVKRITSTAFSYISRHKSLLLALVWIVLGWLIAAVTGQGVVQAILYTVRLVVYLYGIHILMEAWRENPLPVHTKTGDITIPTVTSLTVLFVTFAVLGLLQYAFIPDTRFLASLGWDDHYYRLLSTQLDPNFAGLLIVFGMFTAIQLTKPAWRLFSVSILALSLVLTWSRASWLALAAGLLWLTWKASKKKIIHLGIITFIVGTAIFILPKPAGEGGNLLRTSTIASRFSNATHWLQTLQPYQWLTGAGLFVPVQSTNTDAAINNARLPDAWPITLLVGTGAVGTTMVLLSALQHKKTWNSLQAYQQATLLAAAIHSLFNNSLTQPFIFLALFVILIYHQPSSNKRGK